MDTLYTHTKQAHGKNYYKTWWFALLLQFTIGFIVFSQGGIAMGGGGGSSQEEAGFGGGSAIGGSRGVDYGTGYQGDFTQSVQDSDFRERDSRESGGQGYQGSYGQSQFEGPSSRKERNTGIGSSIKKAGVAMAAIDPMIGGLMSLMGWGIERAQQEWASATPDQRAEWSQTAYANADQAMNTYSTSEAVPVKQRTTGATLQREEPAAADAATAPPAEVEALREQLRRRRLNRVTTLLTEGLDMLDDAPTRARGLVLG